MSTNHSVVNFRTSNVAVFALFEINSVDSACLYSMVDDVNRQNAQTINVEDFATRYCGASKFLFVILWEKYYTGIYNKDSLKPAKAVPAWMKSKKYNVTISSRRSSRSEATSNPDTEMGTAVPETIIELPPEPRHHKPLLPPSYLELMCFLLFFMSVKDIDLIRWIYWLFYYLYGIEPEHKHFYDLVDTLWGVNEKTKYKRNRCKTRLDYALKHVEVDEICPNKMKIVDIQSGGAWSKPLLALRNTLIASTLGKSCWMRISQSVQQCSEHISESYAKLQDHYRVSEWSEDNPIIRGDRRAARKCLRQFLREYKKYLVMPDDTDDRVAEEVSLTGVSSSLLEAMGQFMMRPFRRGGKVNPGEENDNERSAALSEKSGATTGTAQYGVSGHQAIKKRLQEAKQRQRQQQKGSWLPFLGGGSKDARGAAAVMEGGGAGEQRQHDAATPLEVIYKESLTAPLAVLYSQSHTAQDKVRALLRECEDELTMSREDFLARHEEQVRREQEEALRLRGRVSRQVVVDVSSSESESDGEAGEGDESGKQLENTAGDDDDEGEGSEEG